MTMGATDREATRRFYRTVLPTLGYLPSTDDPLVEWGDLSVGQAGDGRPVTTRLHIGFVAPSAAHVESF